MSYLNDDFFAAYRTLKPAIEGMHAGVAKQRAFCGRIVGLSSQIHVRPEALQSKARRHYEKEQ